MNTETFQKFHDDLTILLNKYHLDGAAGFVFRSGIPTDGFVVYNPADLPTKLAVMAFKSWMDEIIKQLPVEPREEYGVSSGKDSQKN